MRSQVLALVRKDLTLETRSKANLNALVVLAVLLLLIISFAMGPSTARLHAVAGGALWVAIAFAGVLAFRRTYEAEAENRAFEGQLLAGAEPRAIYLAKLLVTVGVMIAVELVVGLLMGVLYGIAASHILLAVATVGVLGSTGFAAVGVLYGRLTMSVRAREIMLPLLVLPVVAPALLAAVKASNLILTSPMISWSALSIWFEVLAVFDLVFITAGLMTFGALVDEA